MAEPMILELLDNLKTRVATNETNIATNASTIATNKQLFDTHTADDTRHWTTTDRQNFDRVVHFKGYYTTAAKLQEAYPTAQIGDYAIVGATDTVWAWDDSSNKWLNTTEQGVVITVNGRTGEVILTKTDVGLSNVDNTSDVNKPVSTAQQTALNAKADRKKITAADVDGVDLRAGIYDLYNVNRTILGFSSNYWTVIVGENTSNNKSRTQIWINYLNEEVQHMYVRHYNANTNTWKDFTEILTSDHLSIINSTLDDLQDSIDTNAEDIATLKSDKADRKTITIAQADGSNLRAGMYDVQGSKTINGFTATHWNVLIGEFRLSDGARSATQTWINYSANSVIHIYTRRQQSASIWSDFTEVLTDTQKAEINQAISNEATARQNADTNLENNKADRKIVSEEQIDSINTLKGGLYTLANVSKTILGYTYSYWNIVNIELDANNCGSQIWVPIASNASNLMFIRHQVGDASGNRSWGSFSRILTDADFTNLQSQITTNAGNIATNATNITDLQNNKADRGIITLAQADAFDLKAGIYGISNESKTILGFTSSYWNVYIASNASNNTKSSSQIWFNIATNETPHMYIRHQQNASASWSNFVEIYTTAHFAPADLLRFKQYKGYFTDLTALQTAYPSATAGDYAIAGDAIYIWNADNSKWQQASGSGSTGINKWSIRRFEGIQSGVAPDFTYLTNKTLEKQWEIDDTDSDFINERVVDYKFFLIETFVNMQNDTDITTSDLICDDGIGVYINGERVFLRTSGSGSSSLSLTINLKQGWNKIQVILQDQAGLERFRLGVKISSNTNCISMDCYHSEPELTLGYVPLRGDSTITGSVTVTGTVAATKVTATQDIIATGDLRAGGVVKITDNSYLQYNASDKSLSFMFN